MPRRAPRSANFSFGSLSRRASGCRPELWLSTGGLTSLWISVSSVCICTCPRPRTPVVLDMLFPCLVFLLCADGSSERDNTIIKGKRTLSIGPPAQRVLCHALPSLCDLLRQEWPEGAHQPWRGRLRLPRVSALRQIRHRTSVALRGPCHVLQEDAHKYSKRNVDKLCEIEMGVVAGVSGTVSLVLSGSHSERP
jgi:hypothetical protein